MVANDIWPTVHNETTLREGGPVFFRDTLKSRIINLVEKGRTYSVWGGMIHFNYAMSINLK